MACPQVITMNEAKIRGKVHLVEDTKTYGQKGFRKRLVVLEDDNDRFTNFIPVEFVQDNCDSADELSVGQDVEIRYRLSGRRWQKDSNSEVKFFLNAEAIDFKVIGGSGGNETIAASTSDPNSQLAEAADVDDDDIPF